VKVGIAAIVCVDATLAVCAIRILTEFESSVGMGLGVAKPGTHPMISVRVMSQTNKFILRVVDPSRFMG
jgi:hypothetical protein